ncbi:MAG: hypothetical protein ACRDHY_17215 [Anaerolineales bacterium]
MDRRPRRVARIDGWATWDDALGDYVLERAQAPPPQPPAPPPKLPPLAHPFGIDVGTLYRVEQSSGSRSRVIEIPGTELLKRMSEINSDLRCLDVPAPLVPLINIFEADRHRDRPPEIEWASINEIHALTRQGGRILLNPNGDIVGIGRYHLHQAGWDAWLRLYQARLREAEEAVAAQAPPMRETESAEVVPIEPPRPRPWKAKEAKSE